MDYQRRKSSIVDNLSRFAHTGRNSQHVPCRVPKSGTAISANPRWHQRDGARDTGRQSRTNDNPARSPPPAPCRQRDCRTRLRCGDGVSRSLPRMSFARHSRSAVRRSDASSWCWPVGAWVTLNPNRGAYVSSPSSTEGREVYIFMSATPDAVDLDARTHLQYAQ